jgi:protein-tyrosine phosphatase
VDEGIGVTFCPGKYDPHAQTGSWDRDLALDLDAIRKWGATAVVTLVEDKELSLLKVPQLGEEVRQRGMAWYHLPIVDVSTPDEDFERAWESAGEELRALLKRGADVVVHCRGGLGRAGTIAARLLVELGMDPKTAVATVRSARPGAVETREQETFVLNLQSKSGPGQKQAGDWFEQLTGFRETNYDDTRAKLAVEGTRLRSLINGESYGIGELELATLQALRERVKSGAGPVGRLKAVVATGDVRQMHQLPENEGALFQVASQFNLLEMTSPSVTPEQGVTRYQHDRTQGPACAIACGAATIYRNYFAPFGDGSGQTASRQLDGIAGIGKAMSHALGKPVRRAYGRCGTAMRCPAIPGSMRFPIIWGRWSPEESTNSVGSWQSAYTATWRSLMRLATIVGWYPRPSARLCRSPTRACRRNTGRGSHH